MKIKYLNTIIIVCLLILISGCGGKKDDMTSENIVQSIDDGQDDSVVIVGSGEVRDTDSNTADSGDESDVVVIDGTGTDPDFVRDLIEDLVGDTTTVDEADAGDEVSEEREIIIENFRGNPKDLTVEAGTTVKWTNMMYFQHIIIILPEEDGIFSNRWINDLKEIWYEESYEYTFEEPGKYQWGSKSKFDITKGLIIVVE